MSQQENLHSCLNCDRSEQDIPLVNLRYAGKPAWICTQCLPMLIHHPERVAGRLRGAAAFPSYPPEG